MEGQIITLVVLVAVSAAVSFLMHYCYDKVDWWKSEDEDFHLRMPSLYDFSVTVSTNCYDEMEEREDEDFRLMQQSAFDLKNQSILDRYVTKRICPAYYYFILRNELVDMNNEAGEGGCFQLLFIQTPLFLGMMRALYRIGFTESSFLCGAIALALCVIGSVAASFIYRRKFELPPFRYSMTDLEDRFTKYFTKEFDVSDEVALNSYIIDIHMQYLLSIEDTMRRRKVMRKFIDTLGVIMFILFFIPSE